jgi:hypothetical protein
VKQSIIDQRGITDIEAFFSDGGGSATLLSADKVS